MQLIWTVTFTVLTACIPALHNHSHHYQCRTPYAAVHTLVLLMMGIMMPETCWDKSLIINFRLVASSWFLSLHPTFMMHGHKSLKTRSRALIPGRSKTFVFCTKASRKALGPNSHLFNGYREIFRITDLRLLPKLRMPGCILLFPQTPSQPKQVPYNFAVTSIL